jgi:hypothetical protein
MLPPVESTAMTAFKAFTITAAEDHGYYVTAQGRPGEYRAVLFAGPLGDCLRYIRQQLVDGDDDE